MRPVGDLVAGPDKELSRTYPGCMKAAGNALAGGRNDLVSEHKQRRTSRAVTTAAERSAAVADARCRADAYAKSMAALDAPLQEFADSNAARLDQLAERPEQLQAQAKQTATRLDLAVTWI